jgi:hypothetical protein
MVAQSKFSSKVACVFFLSNASNNYTPRTIKVLKGATLSRTDKHEEKSQQKTITLRLCETLIHLSSIAR